jgi:ketosteroid isomerase-like protein
MTTRSAQETVEQFWALMRSNDFFSVGALLADDYVLEWPQSNERIRGRENFGRMNHDYPAHGLWTFTLNALVAAGDQVVTDVNVSDGAVHARVLSFFTVRAGQITFVREFWPEPFDAPANRAHLVERMA